MAKRFAGCPIKFWRKLTVLAMLKYFPCLILIFMGTMDCATTVIGTVYYDTQELNPLIAHLVDTNLPVFVVIKIAVTVLVGIIFVLAERTLMQNQNHTDRSFRIAHRTLRITYIGIILFLTLVVLNNLLVLLHVA